MGWKEKLQKNGLPVRKDNKGIEFLRKYGPKHMNRDFLPKGIPSKKQVKEDAGISNSGISTNNVGDGKVAAVGIGAQGEPPGNNKKGKRKLRDIISRLNK